MSSVLRGFGLAAALWSLPFLWAACSGGDPRAPTHEEARLPAGGAAGGGTPAEEHRADAPASAPSAFDPYATYGHTRAEVFRTVLRNNLGVAAFALAGLVTFGLTTVTTMAGNGMVLGLIVREQLALGMPPGELASLTLPHGVPEVMGLWLAGGVGLHGAALALGCFRRGLPPPAAALWRLLGATAAAILIIIVAAWVEAFVTLRTFLPG